uniref:Uncharacterized protein n=1 Tax=Psilocybe cubensis TaxID=181762 RepID=A0A8H8CG78_PSICU
MAEVYVESASTPTLNQFVDREATCGNTRTLEFYAKDLGTQIDLLLMFEPPKVGKLSRRAKVLTSQPGSCTFARRVYVDLFPLAWKVISFSGTGTCNASVTYSADTGFFVPSFQGGNRVSASNAQHCQTGEKCTLKVEDTHRYITSPVPGVKGVLQCTNLTERPASLGIGFFNDTGFKIEPALLWDNVANNYTLSVQLTPKLKIYAVSGYKTTDVIRADIESPVLFDENLIGLQPNSDWIVSIDVATGEVRIDPAN